MIQFNLLPDVKLQYIRATYRKRVIIAISLVSSAVFLTIFILLFLFVRVNQPRHISNLDKDIKKSVSTLNAKKDLNKVLTIQNQLGSLPSLHEQKVYTSRLFDYLTQVTPNQVTISTVDLDVDAKTLDIKGEADSISIVNKFADTLKFTDYQINGDDSKKGKAFSSVVLSSFSVGASGSKTSYNIKLSYEPNIFLNTAKDGDSVANSVTLTVPKIITTRSETEKPSSLFQAAPSKPTEGNN